MIDKKISVEIEPTTTLGLLYETILSKLDFPIDRTGFKYCLVVQRTGEQLNILVDWDQSVESVGILNGDRVWLVGPVMYNGPFVGSFSRDPFFSIADCWNIVGTSEKMLMLVIDLYRNVASKYKVFQDLGEVSPPAVTLPSGLELKRITVTDDRFQPKLVEAYDPSEALQKAYSLRDLARTSETLAQFQYLLMVLRPGEYTISLPQVEVRFSHTGASLSRPFPFRFVGLFCSNYVEVGWRDRMKIDVLSFNPNLLIHKEELDKYKTSPRTLTLDSRVPARVNAKLCATCGLAFLRDACPNCSK